MAMPNLKQKVGPFPLYVYIGGVAVVIGVIYIRSRGDAESPDRDAQGVVGPVLDPTNGQPSSGIPSDGSFGGASAGAPPAAALSDVIGLVGDLQSLGLMTTPGMPSQGTGDLPGSGSANAAAPAHKKPPTVAERRGLKPGQLFAARSAKDNKLWYYRITSTGAAKRLRRVVTKKPAKPKAKPKTRPKPKARVHVAPKPKAKVKKTVAPKPKKVKRTWLA